MLVLSRKKHEEIIIDGDVIISVVEIRGDKVRLGITAPKHKSVHRREVADRIATQIDNQREGDTPCESM